MVTKIQCWLLLFHYKFKFICKVFKKFSLKSFIVSKFKGHFQLTMTFTKQRQIYIEI